jgi:rubrerythrin
MEFKGSKTEKNIMTAFAGESQARNKYTFFSSVAAKEGYQQIASLFVETADNEKEHAKILLRMLGGIGTTPENLLAAAQGENYEWTTMYKEFAATAKEEGFEAIAETSSAVEKNSEHHLAKAIIGDAKARLLHDIPEVTGFEAYPGYGVKGMVNQALVLVGTVSFMSINHISVFPEVESDIREEETKGRTVVIVSENKKIIGLISIADKIREDSYYFVSGLKKAGVKRVVMLTGDNVLAARMWPKGLAFTNSMPGFCRMKR